MARHSPYSSHMWGSNTLPIVAGPHVASSPQCTDFEAVFFRVGKLLIVITVILAFHDSRDSGSVGCRALPFYRALLYTSASRRDSLPAPLPLSPRIFDTSHRQCNCQPQ